MCYKPRLRCSCTGWGRGDAATAPPPYSGKFTLYDRAIGPVPVASVSRKVGVRGRLRAVAIVKIYVIGVVTIVPVRAEVGIKVERGTAGRGHRIPDRVVVTGHAAVTLGVQEQSSRVELKQRWLSIRARGDISKRILRVLVESTHAVVSVAIYERDTPQKENKALVSVKHVGRS